MQLQQRVAMAGYENGETIEATMGRFFNAADLASRPVPELYEQAAKFHAANDDIIQSPLSFVAGLTLGESTDELRHERFLVDGMSKRTIWLGIDTSMPQDAYRFIISGFGHRGFLHRYDVVARADGSQDTTHFVLDGQNSLLRKKQLVSLTAQTMVHQAVDFLLTHPETERVLDDVLCASVKAASRLAELLAKQERGTKLSSEEKKAIKATKSGGLLAGSWRPLDQAVPRVG